MRNQIWSFASNIFEVVTRGNFKKMSDIGESHLAKLQAQDAQPDILDMYNQEHPLVSDYSNAYNLWKSKKDLSQEDTQNFTEDIEELRTTKIENWETDIRKVYKKYTSRYKGIFPKGRKPFQSGEYFIRVQAVEQLITKIGDDVALAAVKTDVEAFYATFLLHFQKQDANANIISNLSADLEIKRLLLAAILFKTLGKLMSKYSDNPIQVESYYDLTLIRKINTTHPKITKTLAKGATFNWPINFTEETIIRVKNLGLVPIHVGRAEHAADPITAGDIVQPNDTTDIVMSTIGVGAFLNFTNEDIISKAKFHAEVL
ncbi:MAG: hypothetical protein NTX03_10050 [Bacteroidetes bacterium]|nr:hypothetical protein [Bacteroidota bacterium]